MKRPVPIVGPSAKDLLTLRFMIFIGLICIILFLDELTNTMVQSAPLYWMLMTTLGFSGLRLLHEWIHYFSIRVPLPPPREKIYTVDIFTTFCKGEPYAMIEETLAAIKAITYPHETYLCDESDDPYLKQLCLEMGIHHVTRTLKINAKAGNINNALQQSIGELCVVLDPDHVPFPDFLDPIVDHFNDSQIGFVQIVQAYDNAHHSLIAKGAAQQTFQFYGPMMMTMNSYGTVLAIGANCTFRRQALESIGGHAAGLAEDMHTAMQLHAKGWKSVYVPAVLARGLVPTTLSAYYSQQLKWARGVFDLLVTAYPKLFRQFTWQQKLHYGTLPIHYLSGVIFLINFLIPILSLVFNTSPLDIDFSRFLTLAFPVAGMTFLVRLYVQKWVMEEEERGFHVVGGLLMIGTWWIFILGFVYTLLGKKIPYIPTPKDDHEDSNWHLSVPNFVMIALSLMAIGYGLYQDWNPYNLIMACFALFNCLILGFTIMASRQYQIRAYANSHQLLGRTFEATASVKSTLWLLRRKVYKAVRHQVVFLTLAIIGAFVYMLVQQRTVAPANEKAVDRKNLLIAGLFAPAGIDGLTSLKSADALSKESGIQFGIISLYLPWGDAPRCELPLATLDSIYQRNAIPMISWEPWQNLFEGNADQDDKKIFQRIVEGRYDNYLNRLSKQLAKLNKPVFLRFAHETDNPQYPWSARGENTPEEFKAAWKYVHRLFAQNKAHQVVWVWNPWKPQAVQAYFPGKPYVDWLGVTALNYGTKPDNQLMQSMSEVYAPFHQNLVFKLGLPVMLTEMGTLGTAEAQKAWMEEAFQAIAGKYPEVKSFILFHHPADHNTVHPADNRPIDWRMANLDVLHAASRKDPNTVNTWLSLSGVEDKTKAARSTASPAYITALAHMKGINYAKGKSWTTNGHALKSREINADFEEMKHLGINQVKYFGLNFYDDNVLKAAMAHDFKVVYAFWLPEKTDYLKHQNKLDAFTEEVMEKVIRLKANNSIVMWNIANTPLSKFTALYYPPDTYTAQRAYLRWLSGLLKKIKAADPQRAISVDVLADQHLQRHLDVLQEEIPQADAFGLVLNKDSAPLATALEVPYFYSSAAPEQLGTATANKGFFAANWQDEKTVGVVSLDGLKDDQGHRKAGYHLLAKQWRGKTPPAPLPEVKILLPAITLYAGTEAIYHALIYKDQQWQVARQEDLSYRWELVEYDRYKTPLRVTSLGTGTKAKLIAPDMISRYKIHLYVTKNDQVQVVSSELNIRLK